MGVCVLGSINLDIVHAVARLPRPGETVLGLSSARFLGGKGANQAVAAARMGAEVRFVGAVGDDADGAELLARLTSEGVQVGSVARKAGQASGTAFICVSAEGENQIVVASGANADLAPEDLPAAALEGCAVALAQLETPAETTAALFERAAGAIRILNGAPAIEAAMPLLALADILIVNETELAIFAGLDAPPEGADACAMAAEGLARGGQTVVVTLGAAGAVAIGPHGRLDAPGLPAKAVDTTGAGDCFCGALAAELSLGRDLAAALALANAAAALSVTRPGAAASMPTRAELGGQAAAS